MNVYTNQWQPNMPTFTDDPFCKVETTAIVDDVKFYTIYCHKTISDWIRKQPDENKEWYQHIDRDWTMHANKFDISEEMYLMLKLKWSV